MIVCLCKGLTDKHVRDSIRRGAASVEDVGDDCGAGTGCGSCHGMIELMLADDGSATPIELARQAARSPACADCPRRSIPGVLSPGHKKLGEAA